VLLLHAVLAVAYQRQVKASEKKMAKFMEQAHEQLDAGFELKAVFVTFNTQGEASKCLAGCPRREWACRQLRLSGRLLRLLVASCVLARLACALPVQYMWCLYA
jgi:hypothetical protein